MHPFAKESSDLTRGVSPYLDVRLKPGWRFNRRRRALVSEAGQSVSLRGILPRGTTIVPMVPSLADSDPQSLSEDERLLARHFQIMLLSDTNPTDVAAALRDLEGMELVSIPPRIGLP